MSTPIDAHIGDLQEGEMFSYEGICNDGQFYRIHVHGPIEWKPPNEEAIHFACADGKQRNINEINNDINHKHKFKININNDNNDNDNNNEEKH